MPSLVATTSALARTTCGWARTTFAPILHIKRSIVLVFSTKYYSVCILQMKPTSKDLSRTWMCSDLNLKSLSKMATGYFSSRLIQVTLLHPLKVNMMQYKQRSTTYFHTLGLQSVDGRAGRWQRKPWFAWKVLKAFLSYTTHLQHPSTEIKFNILQFYLSVLEQLYSLILDLQLYCVCLKYISLEYQGASCGWLQGLRPHLHTNLHVWHC